MGVVQRLVLGKEEENSVSGRGILKGADGVRQHPPTVAISFFVLKKEKEKKMLLLTLKVATAFFIFLEKKKIKALPTITF